MSSRRREPRFAPSDTVLAEIRASDGSTPIYQGHAVELSGGGLRLEIPDGEQLRPDLPVQVRLSHPDDEPELVEAVIRRITGQAPRTVHLRVDVLTHLAAGSERQVLEVRSSR